jgi:hypothetical protein
MVPFLFLRMPLVWLRGSEWWGKDSMMWSYRLISSPRPFVFWDNLDLI